MAKQKQKTRKRKTNWIADATKNKGALHRQLGVPEGQKIPAAEIKAAAKKGGKLGARARLAQTLKRMPKKKKKGSRKQ